MAIKNVILFFYDFVFEKTTCQNLRERSGFSSTPYLYSEGKSLINPQMSK
jgi:hypothetical protein